eukprot:g15823.t1
MMASNSLVKKIACGCALPFALGGPRVVDGLSFSLSQLGKKSRVLTSSKVGRVTVSVSENKKAMATIQKLVKKAARKKAADGAASMLEVEARSGVKGRQGWWHDGGKKVKEIADKIAENAAKKANEIADKIQEAEEKEKDKDKAASTGPCTKDGMYWKCVNTCPSALDCGPGMTSKGASQSCMTVFVHEVGHQIAQDTCVAPDCCMVATTTTTTTEKNPADKEQEAEKKEKDKDKAASTAPPLTTTTTTTTEKNPKEAEEKDVPLMPVKMWHVQPEETTSWCCD